MGVYIFIICLCVVVIAVVAIVLVCVLRRKHRQAQQADTQKYKVQKGIEGENYVDDLLEQLEEPFRVFRDIVLDTESKVGTTEIDFLVVCENGIFVLDVKSWEGLYRCKVTKGRSGLFNYDLVRYDNGIKQFVSCSTQAVMRNAAHYKAVKELITANANKKLNKWLNGKFHSYVVFRKDNFSGECDRAVNAKDLLSTIRSFNGKLDEQDVQDIAEIIRDHHSKITREQHIKNLLELYPEDYEDAA